MTLFARPLLVDLLELQRRADLDLPEVPGRADRPRPALLDGRHGDSAAVRSWEEHYFGVRVRFFTLAACFVLSLAVSGFLIRDLPVAHRVRLIQAVLISIFLAGALSDSRALHRMIGPAITVALVLVTTALGLGLL